MRSLINGSKRSRIKGSMRSRSIGSMCSRINGSMRSRSICVSGPNSIPSGPSKFIIPSIPGIMYLNRLPSRMTSLAFPAVTCTSRNRPPE